MTTASSIRKGAFAIWPVAILLCLSGEIVGPSQGGARADDLAVRLDRVFDAARRYQAKSIGIAGGVSANSRLRAELQEHGRLREMPTFLPSLALSTDNAAMIAAAGLRKFRAGSLASPNLNADASLVL